MNVKETFSRNLRHMRIEKKASVHEIAASLDVDLSRYRIWEAGRSLPRYECLIAISELFGISIDCILKVNMAMEDLNKCRA